MHEAAIRDVATGVAGPTLVSFVKTNAALVSVCEAAGMARPHILFWGHEPRPATGWTDAERVGSYVYNTAIGHGLGWRIPDAPFVMETFCMRSAWPSRWVTRGDRAWLAGSPAMSTAEAAPHICARLRSTSSPAPRKAITASRSSWRVLRDSFSGDSALVVQVVYPPECDD